MITILYMPSGAKVFRKSPVENPGEDYFNAFSDMMLFDALICNTDRHLHLDETLHYDILQKTFMDALPPDVAIYNEYHALIVALCKESCNKSSCGEICSKISDIAIGN